jgi:transposase InsO family protein
MARILTAEESTTELAFLQEIFKGTAHEIITASDGLEAEKIARSTKIDQIIHEYDHKAPTNKRPEPLEPLVLHSDNGSPMKGATILGTR